MFSFRDDNIIDDSSNHHDMNGDDEEERVAFLTSSNDDDDDGDDNDDNELDEAIENARSQYNNKNEHQKHKSSSSFGKRFASMGPMLIFAVVFSGTIGTLIYDKQHQTIGGDDKRTLRNENQSYNGYLNIKDINNHCMDGNAACQKQCMMNPLLPQSRRNDKDWVKGHEQNIQDAKAKASSEQQEQPLDVIFMGDDIINEWASEESKTTTHYKTFFASDTSYFKGLALGLNGDTTSNLLWRLQNEEVPIELSNPKIYWINIGTNNFGSSSTSNNAEDYCSAEVVVMGIKRIIEEMIQLRYNKQQQALDEVKEEEEGPAQNTKKANVDLPYIVINSILPRTESRLKNGNLIDPDDLHKTTLYQEIQKVNDELRSYIKNYFDKNERIVFFDATQNFLKLKSTSGIITSRSGIGSGGDLSNQYISEYTMSPSDSNNDVFIPTPNGYMKYGQQVFKFLKSLLEHDTYHYLTPDNAGLKLADGNAGSVGFN